MTYDTWKTTDPADAVWEEFPPATEPRIKTRMIFPPIPTRQFDWCAWIDGEEERRCYGYGRTEAEAITDLVNTYIRE